MSTGQRRASGGLATGVLVVALVQSSSAVRMLFSTAVPAFPSGQNS